jgi:hypothetical protein
VRLSAFGWRTRFLRENVMPKMISKVAHIYAGRALSAGDPFEADTQYVATLVALGRAELAPMQSAQQYQTRDMAAAAPAAVAAPAERQKRKYNTKRKAA